MRAAELHDVGKMAIPDEILHKPGPLTDEEWAFVRQHTIIGERILSAAPALLPVAKLVRASHEHWDGSGYPDGLAGEAIPLGARIVAVCDAFDAMTTQPPVPRRDRRRGGARRAARAAPGRSSTPRWSRRSARRSPSLGRTATREPRRPVAPPPAPDPAAGSSGRARIALKPRSSSLLRLRRRGRRSAAARRRARRRRAARSRRSSGPARSV